MLLTKNGQRKDFKSKTCGLLTEYLSNHKSPISITVVKNIKPTQAHYHKKITEIYWVRNGEITLQIDTQSIDLESGDSILVEPHESHKVIKASQENEIIVLCNPPWELDDEFIA